MVPRIPEMDLINAMKREIIAPKSIGNRLGFS
jgi:hypothetical protein